MVATGAESDGDGEKTMPVETMYGVSCDECDECLFHRSMHAWPSEDDALEVAEDEGWTAALHEGKRRILCPDCQSSD